MGLWHGGGSGVLVETAGSLAAMAHARTFEHSAVGTELSVSHLRPPHGHQVIATATAVHLGKRTTTHWKDDMSGHLKGPAARDHFSLSA